MPPEVVKYLKELSQIVKDTSMDTRHDLNLAFPPSHFSGESNPLMLYYKAFYDTVAYYTALIQSTPEMRDALIKAMADKGYNEDNIDEFLKRDREANISISRMGHQKKKSELYSDFFFLSKPQAWYIITR